MTVRGKYKFDKNFVNIFSGNTMYTVARNNYDWTRVKVGETFANGQPFTKADYDHMEAECDKEGIFEIYEDYMIIKVLIRAK